MEYTPNYQLPLWDKEDAVKRTDFNENNQKVDTALHQLSQPNFVIGTLNGLQTGSVIELGFRPSYGFLIGLKLMAIFIGSKNQYRNYASEADSFGITLTDTGVVFDSVSSTVTSSYTVTYIFFK